MTGDAIGEKSAAVRRMDDAMELPEILMGGTRLIRENASDWLPQAEREPTEKWNARVAQSFLFPFYKDTVRKLAAMPFKRKYTLTGAQDGQELPPKTAKLIANADREGTPLHGFMRQRFFQMCHRGWSLIQVDKPRIEEGASQADTDRIDPYAYFVKVRPQDVLGADKGRTKDGRIFLARIRIHSTATEGDELVHYVMEYKDDGLGNEKSMTWKKYKKTSDERGGEEGISGFYTEDGDGVLMQTGKGLPFMFLPTAPDCPYWEGVPALEDLAFMNLAHFQSDSAQRNYLKVARIPIVNRRNATASQVREGLTIGASHFSDSTGDTVLEFVETKGNAMDAGRADLDALETAMKEASAQPTIIRERTATEVESDDSKSGSLLHDWKTTLEEGMQWAFEVAAIMNGEELPEGFGVKLFSDFGINARAGNAAENVLTLMDRGKLSDEDGLSELQALGALSTARTPEQFSERARAQPPLGLVE